MWFLEWRLSHTLAPNPMKWFYHAVTYSKYAHERMRECEYIGRDARVSAGLFVLFYLFSKTFENSSFIPKKESAITVCRLYWDKMSGLRCYSMFKHTFALKRINRAQHKLTLTHTNTIGSGNAEKEERNNVDRRVYQLKNKSTHRSAIVLFPGRLVYLFYIFSM